MPKLSIYDNAWTDLVFEGKNKEYGAYQLRRENPKTTFKAIALTVSLAALVLSLPFFMSSFGGAPVKPGLIPLEPTIVPVNIQQKSIKAEQPKTKPAAPLATKAPQVPSLSRPVVTADPVPADPAPASNPSPAGQNPGTVGAPGTPGESRPGTNLPNAVPATTAPEEGPAVYVDVKPKFPGGIENFYNYITRNFNAPEESGSSGASLKIFVYFVVEKDGTMTDIKALKNPGYGLDKEAVRVLKSLRTKWEPGMLRGEKIRTAYSLPITIRLNN